jgi:uncharacterized protein YecA (UPF0149 family)
MNAMPGYLALQGTAAAIVAATQFEVFAGKWTESDTQKPIRHNRTFYTGRQTGRNQPCPCGSGQKYKRCCMRNDPSKQGDENET